MEDGDDEAKEGGDGEREEEVEAIIIMEDGEEAEPPFPDDFIIIASRW